MPLIILGPVKRPWVSFVPTLTAPGGTLTATSSTGEYWIDPVARLCHFWAQWAISVNSSTNWWNVVMPFAARSAWRVPGGWELANNNPSFYGIFTPGSATMNILRNDGANPPSGTGNAAVAGAFPL